MIVIFSFSHELFISHYTITITSNVIYKLYRTVADIVQVWMHDLFFLKNRYWYGNVSNAKIQLWFLGIIPRSTEIICARLK